MSLSHIAVRRGSTSSIDQNRAYRVLVDDVQVGEIMPGQHEAFPVTAGDHEIELRVDWVSSPRVAVPVEEGSRVTLYCEPASSADRTSFIAGVRLLALGLFRRHEWISLRVVATDE